MRAVPAVAALLFVAGCGGTQAGGVKIAVGYTGPRDACLVVRVASVSKPSKVEERRLDKLTATANRTIGVIPADGDGDALTVELLVRERGCEGKQVWRKALSATAARPAALLEVSIVVRDADDDTFADATGPFTNGQEAGTDCADEQNAVHPGVEERCNGLDDDCNGVRDDGLPPTFFFADSDHDGFGDNRLDAGQTACVLPPGFATDAGDCDDTRPFVHAAAAETCDGLDDDCDQQTDEGFFVGDGCDAGATCSGTLQCTDAGTSACARAMPLLGWYPDEDGDGHGLIDGGAVLACTQPPGRAPSADDCDDTNRFIHTGAREVCDGRDDDCDPTTLETCSDAGFKGFTRFPLPTNAGWNAIAPFGRGFTWVVGDGNQIVLRYFFAAVVPDAGQEDGGEIDAGSGVPGFGDGGFINYTGKCNGNFRAAWATPQGRVYLGEGNQIDRLELDAGCLEGWHKIEPSAEVSGLSGVVAGDGGVTLYATLRDGRAVQVRETGDGGARERTWAPDASNAELYTVTTAGSDTLFVAGTAQPGASHGYFARLDRDSTILAVPGAAQLRVQSSSALGPSLAYFAGSNNTLFSFEDAGYRVLSGPFSAASHFAGVCAFGLNQVLVVDTEARVWRYSGTVQADGGSIELWVDLKPSTNGSLRAIGATAPDDVWVAGDNNSILHFGE